MKRGAKTRADEQELDVRQAVFGRAGQWQRSPNPSRALNVNPAVARRGGRTYLGRPAIGLGIKTEEREIASDPMTGVSRGRSNCTDGAGSIHPASGDAGIAEELGGTFSEHSYGFRPRRSAHNGTR